MATLRTSERARDILEDLRRRSGIRPNLWARCALGYSLSVEEPVERTGTDSGGTEFNFRTLLGDDESTLLALLRQREGFRVDETDAAALLKDHIERGLYFFEDQLKRLNRRTDELLLHLSSIALSRDTDAVLPTGVLSIQPSGSLAVHVRLGSQLKTEAPVEVVLNGPGRAPHIAVMGRNGTGKTRSMLSMLSHIAQSNSYEVPMLLFDYAKGDIADNSTFVKNIKAEVRRLPDQTIPIAPLKLDKHDSNTIKLAARRFRDTVSSVVHLGAIQKDRCLYIVESLYAESGKDTPDLPDLVNIAQVEYEDKDIRPDSLLACFREFASFPLFDEAESVIGDALLTKSHVIDIHSLPEDLRKLTTFLVLDRLYAQIMAMPDAEIDASGNRRLRLIIVIDEAHHFLPCKQPTLEKMIREVRSKGVAIALLSQSPDDFDQPRYNFAREIGLPIVFSCVLERPKMLSALLGGDLDSKKLSQLGTGVALTRTHDSDQIMEFQAWKP